MVAYFLRFSQVIIILQIVSIAHRREFKMIIYISQLLKEISILNVALSLKSEIKPKE